MHMYAKNFYGGNGIVGAQVTFLSLFGSDYQEEDGVLCDCNEGE